MEYSLYTGARKTFLPGVEVSRVFRDDEGNTWFTTLGRSLFRLNSDEFINIHLRAGTFDKCPIYSLLDQMQVLLYNVETFHLSQQKMAVPTLTGLIFVAIRDIMRFEAKGSYTAIYLNNGEQIMATRNIKEYEDLLPAVIFCKVHNSHIINLHKIQKYHKGRGGYVIMEDGNSIEVASRRREEFLRRLLK